MARNTDKVTFNEGDNEIEVREETFLNLPDVHLREEHIKKVDPLLAFDKYQVDHGNNKSKVEDKDFLKSEVLASQSHEDHRNQQPDAFHAKTNDRGKQNGVQSD